MSATRLIALVATATFTLPALATDVERADAADSTSAPAISAAGDPAAQEGYVERSTITTNMIDREPQDEVRELTNDHTQVFYFSDLRNLAGETVTHRWEFDGSVMAEIPFAVGAPRWRVHSSKNLLPKWVGEWTVSIVDSSGQVLVTDTFVYTQAIGGEADAELPPVGEGPADSAQP
jgi:hypothetical protein